MLSNLRRPKLRVGHDQTPKSRKAAERNFHILRVRGALSVFTSGRHGVSKLAMNHDEHHSGLSWERKQQVKLILQAAEEARMALEKYEEIISAQWLKSK